MLKAQFCIVSISDKTVNPILPISVIAAFILFGCGFQLNRNKINLPDNARSIAVFRIENRSYTPGLDIYVRDALTEKFARNGIEVTSQQIADLSLSFQIVSSNFTRTEYALDSNNQTYDFVFNVSGKLRVVNNNTRKLVLDPPPNVTGTYSIKTESEDLTQIELEDARRKSLDSLCTNIISYFTQSF